MKMDPKDHLIISRVTNGWIIHRGNNPHTVCMAEERYVATYESELRQIVKVHCDAQCPNAEQPEGMDAGVEVPVVQQPAPVPRESLKHGLECPNWISGDDKARWEEAAMIILQIDNDNVAF